MSEKKIYPYEIPDSFFKPHKVVRTFYAKVIYKVVDDKPVIEEVGLSPKCLKYINNTAGLMARIEDKINNEHRAAVMLKGVHPVFQRALAPFINH